MAPAFIIWFPLQLSVTLAVAAVIVIVVERIFSEIIRAISIKEAWLVSWALYIDVAVIPATFFHIAIVSLLRLCAFFFAFLSLVCDHECPAVFLAPTFIVAGLIGLAIVVRETGAVSSKRLGILRTVFLAITRSMCDLIFVPICR